MSRTSINDPDQSPPASAECCGMSDFEAVDNTSGTVMTLFSFLTKFLWGVIILLGLCALSFPYLFPDWSTQYRKQLSEMGIAANTGRFFKNASEVDWKSAFNALSLRSLRLVGTGFHPQFNKDDNLTNENLEKNYWYTGEVFIMKRYVTDLEYRRFSENIFKLPDAEDDMLYPATGIEHGEALEYCSARGGRLPTWEELRRALHLADTREWQGRTGSFIKPNLEFSVWKDYALWTGTPEGDGFFDGDNFMIFNVENDNITYEDDGYQDDKLSFLCAIDEK